MDKIGALMGHPPMPWQSYVSAVANELNDDGTFKYRTVILSTPRQSGKSSLLGATFAHRALSQRDFRGWYSAQTGQAARDSWYEWKRMLSASMPDRWRFRLSNGEESAVWEANDSFIRIFPPTPDSLHGRQSDLVALDEVWSLGRELGDALLQAVVPTQATRKQSQLWIVSTAGDDSSDWMRDQVMRGRESVDDPDTTTAHFEWAAPDDAPTGDPETWERYHPAFGRTISAESMQTALEQMGDAQFRRGYLNSWPAAASTWRTSWGALAGGGIPPNVQVQFGVDSDPLHRHGSIVAAYRDATGIIHVELVEYKPGVEWVVDRVAELTQRHSSPVTIARSGPLGYLIADIQAKGVVVNAANGSEFADAIARTATLVVSRQIRHQADPRLDMAVVNVQATTSDRPIWRRKDSAHDISPACAAALAIWAASGPEVGPQIF